MRLKKRTIQHFSDFSNPFGNGWLCFDEGYGMDRAY